MTKGYNNNNDNNYCNCVNIIFGGMQKTLAISEQNLIYVWHHIKNDNHIINGTLLYITWNVNLGDKFG